MRDKDSVAVQALSCGAAELLHGIAKHTGELNLSTHILSTQPALTPAALTRLRNQYWNAFKHFYEPNQRTVRDDEAVLESFDDRSNDFILFQGWWDYLSLVRKLPVAAQVFQVWWYALNDEKLSPQADRVTIERVFPGLSSQTRIEQKRRLRRSVEKFRKDKEISSDPKTESEPLCQKAMY